MQYYDHIIVGAGPAGIQLAYYFEKRHMSYIILEQSEVAGSFFTQYPRHRQLISVNKVNCGGIDPQKNMENILRYDCNSLLTLSEDYGKIMFRDYSEEYYPPADKIVQYMGDFVKKFNILIAK